MSRRHAPWHRLGTLALTVCLAATALSSLAATYTWDPNGSGADTGGAGTWDASSASWYDGSNWIAWPNDTPNADKAVLGGTAGTVTVAAGTTIYVNNVNLATAAGYVLSGGDATSVLAFDGISPKIDGATTNAACSFSNLLIDTGPGLLITQNGNSNSFNLNAGAAFTGTGKVSVSASGYGMGMNLNAAEPSFVGGFDVARPITTYRSTTLNATVADSLGQGATTVGTGGGAAILSYVFGAQTPGGAGDGGPAGVTAVSNGVVSLSGTWSTSKDRFTIEANSLIRGSSARLASLTRVGAFTDYASPAGPEIILNSGAVVVNTDGAAPTNTIQSLGTTHDLLYGLYGTMNSAGFALTLGGGTPWAGLGKNANGDYTDATLQQGTVTINDAGGTVGEITLRSNGVNYNYAGYGPDTAPPSVMNSLTLGNGANCPTFQLAPGSAKVNARVVGTNGLGNVNLNSSAAGTKFSGALAKFIVGGSERGTLQLQQANATGGVPIDVENNGRLYVANTSGMDSATTIKTGGRLYVDRVFNATGALAVEGGGLLYLTVANGMTGTQNGVSVASAVQAGGIVQVPQSVNDPANLGATQPGAIIEVQCAGNNGQSLGGFAATGQILAHSPEGYNAQAGFISNSGTGGISGTLQIVAASTGTYPHSQGSPFDIREDFAAGSDVTVGPATAGLTIRGYEQNGPVQFSNSANAMSAIHIGGAGVNGAAMLRVPDPGSVNGNAGSPATIHFLCADGGILEIAGGATGMTFYNPISVPAGKLGGVASRLWGGPAHDHRGGAGDAGRRLDVRPAEQRPRPQRFDHHQL